MDDDPIEDPEPRRETEEHDITPLGQPMMYSDDVPDIPIPPEFLEGYDPDYQPPPGDPDYHAKAPRVPFLISLFVCSGCGAQIRTYCPLPERRAMLRFTFRMHDLTCPA